MCSSFFFFSFFLLLLSVVVCFVLFCFVWFGFVWFCLVWFVLFWFGLVWLVGLSVCLFVCLFVGSFVRLFVCSFVRLVVSSSSSSPACFSSLQRSSNKLSQKRVHRLKWCLWDCEVPFLADPMVPVFIAVGHLKDSNHAILCELKHQVHRNCHLEPCRTSNIHGIFVEPYHPNFPSVANPPLAKASMMSMPSRRVVSSTHDTENSKQKPKGIYQTYIYIYICTYIYIYMYV